MNGNSPVISARPQEEDAVDQERKTPTIRPGRHYLGVVVELPEPVAGELQDWRASFDDGSAVGVAPHITVLILDRTELDEGRLLGQLRALLEPVVPFRVRLDGTGTFRPVTPVVYARVVEGGEACTELHHFLRGGLGLDSASPFPYEPHLTLVQGSPEEELDRAQELFSGFVAEFLAASVQIYDLGEDGRWSPREQIPLRG